MIRTLLIDCGSRYINNLHKILLDLTTVQIVPLATLQESDFDQCDRIIMSGSPSLLTERDVQPLLKKMKMCVNSGLPFLGICFGHQLLGMYYGSTLSLGKPRENMEKIQPVNKSHLFEGIQETDLIFQESHREEITLPKNFNLIATSQETEVEGIQHLEKSLFGVQFHPETSNDQGKRLLENFLEQKKCVE